MAPDLAVSQVLAPADAAVWARWTQAVKRRPVKRGDMDRIAREDVGVPVTRLTPYLWWTDESIDVCEARYLDGPRVSGRDCPACPAPRTEHDGWGCARTGCQLSIALITGRPR